MVSFFGDYDTTETVIIPFNTFTSDDPAASSTITNLVAGDVEIHKDGGTTQRASDNGVTVTIDFDSVTGNHIVSIDLSDNSDAGFYAAGSRYQVRIEGTTVDGGTVNAWIGAFSIGCTLRPTTDGRTLDVTATGAAGIDWANVEGQGTSVDLSATAINLCDTVTTLTGHTAQTGDSYAIVNSGTYGNAQLVRATTPANTLDISATGEVSANLTQIDGQATSGNNATLNLAQLNIVNSAGSAIVATSSGGNGHGMILTGNGTGSGIYGVGGATGSGIFGYGGATSGAGIKGAGQTTGDGIVAEGAGAGDGIYAVSGASGDAGIFAMAHSSGNGSGIRCLGYGTGHGLRLGAKNTGDGLNIVGGTTSGDGINITATNGDGISATGGTNGNGIILVGAGAGVDFSGDITGNITGNLSGSAGSVTGAVGSVTGAVGSVTGDVGGNVTGSVGSLAAQAKTDVNAEVVDAINTDTYGEPGQGAPPVTASLVTKTSYLYKSWRNKMDNDGSNTQLYDDAGTTVDQKQATSESGGTVTKAEWVTGP